MDRFALFGWREEGIIFNFSHRRFPDSLHEGVSCGSQHAAALLGDVSQYETRDSQSLNRKPDVSQIAHPPKETDET